MPSSSSLDAVFKFVVRRPPIPEPTSKVLSIDLPTEFQNDLREQLGAEATDRNRLQIAELAQTHAESDEYVGRLDDLSMGDRLAQLVERLSTEDLPATTSLDEVISDVFGESTNSLADEDAFQRDFARLADSVLAAKYSSRTSENIDALEIALRAMAAVNHQEADQISASETGAQAIVFGPKIQETLRDLQGDTDPVAQEPPPKKKDYGRAITELKQLDKKSNFKPREPLNVSTAPQSDQPGQRNFLSFLPFMQNNYRPITALLAAGEGESRQLRYMLTDESIETVSADTRDLLTVLNLDLKHLPLTTIVNQIHAERILESNQEYVEAGPIGVEVAPMPSIPSSSGRVRPAGVADLLVVRQQIKKYERGEVAHIENVLRGERKNREHRRLQREERTIVDERESTVETERELESTERFEIQNEVAKTLREDSRVEAGLTISGSYGPSIDFTASTEGALDRTSEESRSAANTYAKDVIDRSLEKVVERVKSTRSTTRIQETEEINVHKLSGPDDGDHISGVYQWVDKIYEAQIFNYGKRLQFDFVVPEPAALLWHMRNLPMSADQLPEPIEKFPLGPDDITPDNYGRYAALYGASSIEPPPDEYVFISKALATPKNADRDDPVITATETIEVPVGYQVQSFSVNGRATTFNDLDHRNISIVVGDWATMVTDPGGVISFDDIDYDMVSPLADTDEGLRGAIPIAIGAAGYDSYALTVVAKCSKTTFADQKWGHETYQRIREAYEQRVADWESRVASIKDNESLGVRIVGRNPRENRNIEKRELKRGSIELLTEQRFHLFNAMRDGLLVPEGSAFPNFDFGEAEQEGQYLRFFENAFEWPQITYTLYPYFWGRRTKWVERLSAEDLDPEHLEFLKAGAARVVVPVRPGYEKAILHFLETGITWNGSGEPPSVSSPLYVTIAQEFKEATGNFEDEKAVGDPWDVVVPTSLVSVRKDDELPAWEKSEDGDWQPVE